MGLLKKATIAVTMSAMLLAIAGCSGKPAETPAAKAPAAPKFPTKAVEVIVPYAAGGGTDNVARALANSAKDALGQPIVVVNKTGGGGAIGMGEGAQAKPDGHTVTMITVELVTLPHLGQAPIDYAQFEPILRVNVDPAAITVPANAPYNTLQEFLDFAKKNPGKVKVGNSGAGAIWHLAAASLEQKTGAKFNHIPFNGAAPAVTALLGGNLEAVAVSPAEVLTHVQSGKLKVLGVMADQRVKTLPEVKTMKEQGIDLTIGTWRGLAVPKGTPKEIVTALHDAFKKGMDDKAFIDFMDKGGMGIGYMNGETYKASLKTENENFKAVITSLGLNKK